jgi:hypothetical protein
MNYFSMSPNVEHLIVVLGVMVHSDVTNKDNSTVKLIQYVTSTIIEKCTTKFQICT